MNLRIAGVLVGAALVATACGGSAPNLINQAVQAPAQNDVAEQAHQGNTRQANAKAARDTANAKAAAAVTVAPKAVAPKAVAAPKAAPRYTSGNPDCAHLSEYLASDFPSQSSYRNFVAFCKTPTGQSGIGMPNDYTKKPAVTCVSKFGPGTPGVYPNCYDAEAQAAGQATFANCIKAGKVWDKVNQVCKP